MYIPDDFEPNEEHKALAARYGLDIEAEVAAFKRFQHREPIRDMRRAFSGFVRKHGEQSHQRKVLPFPGMESEQAQAQPASKPPTNDPEELKRRFVEAFRESNPREYDRLLKYLEGHKWWGNITERLQLEELRQAIRDRHVIFNHLDGMGHR